MLLTYNHQFRPLIRIPYLETRYIRIPISNWQKNNLPEFNIFKLANEEQKNLMAAKP